MTNIEKLYKLANIEATAIGCTNEDANDCEGDCIDCTWFDEDEVYPPFTDTKQLKLIKWVGSEYETIEITWYSDTGFRIVSYNHLQDNSDFSQALAGLVCELWEDLSDEQQTEIKRILE